MEIGGSGTVAASAVAGIRHASEQLQAAGQKVAEGDTNPATILSVSTAETQFAASAAVLKTANRMTSQLLDIVA